MARTTPRGHKGVRPHFGRRAGVARMLRRRAPAAADRWRGLSQPAPVRRRRRVQARLGHWTGDQLRHARLAVEMLTAADARRAGEIADYLESQNRSRQTIEKQILVQAIEQVESQGMNDDSRRAIVLGGDGWHPGVIGIVASRIVEK